jgi:hypothetical protein
MTKKEEFLALAKRCETEMPSRYLDCDISNAALGTRLFPHGASETGIADTNGKGSVWKAECALYTASIDAAATLRPEGWAYFVEWIGEPFSEGRARLWIPQQRAKGLKVENFITQAQTPALALCAAALRALAEEQK